MVGALNNSDRRAATRDAVLYGASAIHAFVLSSLPVHSIYRAWGRIAVWPYAAGALLAGLLTLLRSRSGELVPRLRLALAIVVLSGAALVPVAREVRLRSETDPSKHAQSHTIITEEAAKTLLAGDNPYSAEYLSGPLESWDLGVKTHFPYMPGMIVFGIPRALDGSLALSDARLPFVLTGLVLFVLATVLWRTSRDRFLLALQVLVILPTGAVFLAGGGHDLPVLALMLLALVLQKSERPFSSGVAMGAAAMIKQTAWILVPFLIAGIFRRGGLKAAGRSIGAVLLVALPVTLPFLIWDRHAFVEDVIRFPLDIGRQQTIARGPTVGRLLLTTFPSARPWLSFALLGLVGVVALILLIFRPPSYASATAFYSGIIFALAMILSTAGRPGYGIYPINLLLWAWLLRTEPLPAFGVRAFRRRDVGYC